MTNTAPIRRSTVVSLGMFLFLGGLVLFGAACPQVPAPCTSDTDCDDELFCNGQETCGADAFCQASTSPCNVGQTCDEASDQCTPTEPGVGAALFADNCASCHGDDGASGFAPDITGMSADALSAGLESASHEAISLTDGEIEAIAGFLAGGEPVAKSLYETHEFDHDEHTQSCDSCHHTHAVSCSAPECHAEEWLGGVINLKEAKHQTCGTCHANETTEDGSWRCSFCHTALLDLPG